MTTVLLLRQVRPPAPLSQQDMTIPVVIMIGREITMSALREWAAASGGAAHRAVKVNTLGKYKTALQARPRLHILLLVVLHYVSHVHVTDNAEDVPHPGYVPEQRARKVVFSGVLLLLESAKRASRSLDACSCFILTMRGQASA